MEKDDLIIVISSFDKAKDCWGPLIDSFRRFWPDCPFPRYIVTNEAEIQEGGFQSLKVGVDKGWASNLRSALFQVSVPCRYILYMQEDFWLTAPVRTCFMEEQIAYCRAKDLDYLRLTCPWMDSYRVDESHALSPVGKEPYALSLSASIWKMSFLKSVLVEGWSGWEFEARATELVAGGCLSQVLLRNVSQREFRLIGLAGGAVRRGRWTREAVRYLRRNGFASLVKGRATEGLFYTMLLSFSRISKYTRILGDRVIVFMHRHKLNF